MIAAAVACAVIALVFLAAIDDWRRRTVEELRVAERRRAARDRAWRAVADDAAAEADGAATGARRVA
jgi:uncharacterized iron-regulated membrane protein